MLLSFRSGGTGFRGVTSKNPDSRWLKQEGRSPSVKSLFSSPCVAGVPDWPLLCPRSPAPWAGARVHSPSPEAPLPWPRGGCHSQAAGWGPRPGVEGPVRPQAALLGVRTAVSSRVPRVVLRVPGSWPPSGKDASWMEASPVALPPQSPRPKDGRSRVCSGSGPSDTDLEGTQLSPRLLPPSKEQAQVCGESVI